VHKTFLILLEKCSPKASRYKPLHSVAIVSHILQYCASQDSSFSSSSQLVKFSGQPQYFMNIFLDY